MQEEHGKKRRQNMSNTRKYLAGQQSMQKNICRNIDQQLNKSLQTLIKRSWKKADLAKVSE